MSGTAFLEAFLDKIKDDNTGRAGNSSAEFSGWIDSGCYILNAQLSGSLYGGIPNNKIVAFAGESGTGKTYLVLGIVKSFLERDPEAIVVYYDTESAVTIEMMKSRGIDTNRVIVSEPETIEAFRHHIIKVIDNYAETKGDKPKLLLVLDSLGMLPTKKEVSDSTEGKDTRDMTRAQLIRGLFRIVRLKLSKAEIPLILTNHTYDSMSLYSPKEMAGGGGVKYAADFINFLAKSKDKDGKDVVGVFIRSTVYKGRLSVENKQVEMRLSYKTGLDRWYGLLELAEKYDIFKKKGNQYELSDGTKVFGKDIEDNPEKYFTEEVLAQLEEAAQKEFKYGQV